jgi:hypothetical protein
MNYADVKIVHCKADKLQKTKTARVKDNSLVVSVHGVMVMAQPSYLQIWG